MDDTPPTDGSLAGSVAEIHKGRDIRHFDGVNTPLTNVDTLDVFPPVGGGQEADLGKKIH